MDRNASERGGQGRGREEGGGGKKSKNTPLSIPAYAPDDKEFQSLTTLVCVVLKKQLKCYLTF